MYLKYLNMIKFSILYCCSYKQRMQEMLDEEDLQDNEKYAKIIQDQAAHDEKILGVSKVLSPSAL